MKIRRLDVIGFKSFADRVGLRFDDGTTGIVGPNGCGKSNVVDAVRWVMGEQSARRLRGKAMEDVIFAGSDSKLPIGMAEVRMTLENDGLNVPPEYTAYAEITVGRRLFRSGESEYSINRTPCRLIDVQELFMGTGVGTKAYSIISQGQIGLLVSQKPQERRSLIEEAAGISKYKARKRIAERKMEQTRQNLLRVNDVIHEIKRTINSMKRQARKAARYRKLRDQLREIELHTAAHRHLELAAVRGHLEQKRKRLQRQETELQSELAVVEAEVEQRRTHLLEEDRAISSRQEQLLSIDNQIKLNEKNIEFLGREVESLTERGQKATAEIGSLRAEAEARAAEIRKARQEEEQLDENARMASLRLRESEEHNRLQAGRVEDISAGIEEMRQTQLELGGRAGELRSRTSNLDQRLVDLEGRLGQAEAERAALQRTRDELEQKTQVQSQNLDRTRQLHLDLVEKREVSENSLAELKAQAQESEARRLALREEIGNRRSRLRSLQEIERNYEGCASGVRWVMQNAQSQQEADDVVGLVADIVQAPARYETAVQAVLGDRLQSVVVRSQDAGLAAVDYLKRESEGRSSFIPISLRDRADHPDYTSIQGNGVVGTMRSLIEFEQQYEPVIRFLLDDVVVVEDLPAAMALWTSNGHKATLVTLDGDVLEPEGVLTGGSLEGAGSHLLQNKREIRELEDRLQALEADYRMAQDREGKLKAQMASMAAAIESLRQNSHQEEIRIIDQEKDLGHLRSQIDATNQRLEVLDRQCNALQAEIDGCRLEMEQARAEIDEIEAKQHELESRLRKAREDHDREKASLAACGQEVLELKVQAAASQERLEAGRHNLEHLQKSCDDLERRIEQLRGEVNAGNHQTVEGRQRIEENREEISRLLGEHASLHQEVGARRDAYEKLMAEVREDEMRAKDRRRNLESVSSDLADARAGLREIELEAGHLCADVRRQHKVEVQDCLAAYHLLPPPGKDDLARAEKMRQALERMGDVNPNAVEAYEEQMERYQFLTTQSQDLEQALEKLHKVIVKINRTSRKRFREAFEAINLKFREVFPRLFNGGKAHLVLEESQDVLEAGVDIVVQPPGKKLQNIELLSGGEKALTAIALLFSIFLVKPTPFCLLDEVDAPLDDVNLDRFNAMIREMSRTSQFIIITHNKRTMETIDRLYGITMEEPGVSKVVTVKFVDDQADQPRAAAAS